MLSIEQSENRVIGFLKRPPFYCGQKVLITLPNATICEGEIYNIEFGWACAEVTFKNGSRWMIPVDSISPDNRTRPVELFTE
jgi:hypothetical protein